MAVRIAGGRDLGRPGIAERRRRLGRSLHRSRVESSFKRLKEHGLNVKLGPGANYTLSTPTAYNSGVPGSSSARRPTGGS